MTARLLYFLQYFPRQSLTHKFDHVNILKFITKFVTFIRRLLSIACCCRLRWVLQCLFFVFYLYRFLILKLFTCIGFGEEQKFVAPKRVNLLFWHVPFVLYRANHKVLQVLVGFLGFVLHNLLRKLVHKVGAHTRDLDLLKPALLQRFEVLISIVQPITLGVLILRSHRHMITR